ncbi:hypothetical protein MY11210_005904 [Beauveria gryllotalpidicola]
MCGGPETLHRPRGGALVALNPPRGASPTALLTGDLTFHTPGQPNSTEATHARLAFDEEQPERLLPSDLCVIIHTGGDLTMKASDCGLFRKLRLSATRSARGARDAFFEWPLPQALSLQVGSEGIIGRRVSVYAENRQELRERTVLAEGIVGFNSWAAERASL